MSKFLFVFLIFTLTLQAEISVKVNRDYVRLNESILVTFKADQKLRVQPDFSPLMRDFDIVSQNQSSSTRMVNGHIDHEVSWQLTLISKRMGDLVIPSIQFGQEQSEPVAIQVIDAAQPTKGDPLFFEVELNPSQNVYEQSQLIYTLRFYRSVNLYNGRLSDLQLSDSDAIVEQLGEDKEYEQMANGTRYLVLERQYALFPQHEGKLAISPMVFEGQMVTSGRSIFNMQTQYARLSSEGLMIDVKPIPPPFNRQNWLAAQDVKLVDVWSGDIAQVAIGEPITRTVTIMADGCLGSQIPPLALNLPADIKQYPDKPQTQNQTVKGGCTGILQTKVAMIFTKPGAVTLPEIKVSWWDVKADKMRTTTLPELTLMVNDTQVVEAPPMAPVEEKPVVQPAAVPIWAWVLIGFNGVWMAAFIFLFFKKKRVKKVAAPADPSLSQLKQLIKQASLANDPKGTEKYLLEWAKKVFPQLKPLNLTTLMEFVSEELSEEIGDLNESLYSPDSLWTGQDFWKAFSAHQVINAQPVEEPEGALKSF